VIQIKSRWDSSKVLYTAENAQDVRAAVLEAVKQGAYLQGAYLQGAYLQGADLEEVTGVKWAPVSSAQTALQQSPQPEGALAASSNPEGGTE
jgi:hypothetical protein